MNTDLIPTAATAITIVTYVFVLSKVLNRSKERKKSEQTKFLTALSLGIKNGKVESFHDIENIFKAVRKRNSDNEVYNALLAEWLREYLLDNVISVKDYDNKTKILVSEFIAKAEKASPHAGLPELERSIVRDIESYLDDQNIDSTKRKVSELVSAIKVREEAYSKAHSTNKWSVPLSIVGLILTVFFGITSLV